MKRTLLVLLALVACLGLVAQAGAVTQTASPEAADDLYVARLLGLDYVSILEPVVASAERRLCDIYDTANCTYYIDFSLQCCVATASPGTVCPNLCN